MILWIYFSIFAPDKLVRKLRTKMYKTKRLQLLLYIALWICFSSLNPLCAQTQRSTGNRNVNRVTIQGQLLDSITGQPIDFANIVERGTTNGTITDANGHFSMLARPGSEVVISYLGYNDYVIHVGNRKSQLNIRMIPNDFELGEVVVKPKRERYRRKDNPAVELMRKVIERKRMHLPEDHDYFKQERYDNMTYSLNNFDEGYVKAWQKKFPFIEEFVDTALVSGGPILPVTTDERIETHYYRKQGNVRRIVTEAEQHAGLDDMLPDDMISILKTEVFPELDLQEDNIYLYRKKFVSPISDFGITFYKYYILDTLNLEDGRQYIDLGFAPLMPQSFGFVGHLYITTDSTYFVKRAELNMPPDINLNFVRNLHVEVENDRLPDSTQVVVRKRFDSEINVTASSLGFYAHRLVRYSGYDSEKPDRAEALFKQAPKTESPNLMKQTADLEYWRQHRLSDDYDPEHSVQAMMERMRKLPFYRYAEVLLGWFFKGFIPLDDKEDDKSHFMFGPTNSLVSWNKLEHARFRLGGITTANISHYLFASGYGAWGVEDHKWKYDAALEYSFRRKKMYANEFPIHSLKLESSYDSRELGLVLSTNRDNFVTSLRRDSDPKYTYVRTNSLLYTLELWNHFSLKVKGELMSEYQSRLGRFREVGTGLEQDHYSLGLGTISLRWAPKESFVQMRTNRIRVDDLHPVFELSHQIAKQGFMGSDFDYQRTDFMFMKRFWLNFLGYADLKIDAGKVWTQVPYTLLSTPNANTGYTIQRGAFSQLQSMEFIYDQFVSWDIVYKMNGLIFNNLPWIRHLKLREIISFRGVYGKLSDKNDPTLKLADGSHRNPNLYELPSNGQVYRLSNEPYMEVAFGIDNIFKMVRLEYIRRLNYLDHEHISKDGVQIAVGFNF